jgi:bifunctional oligoribonuclease and PAP phosphatase NrnA
LKNFETAQIIDLVNNSRSIVVTSHHNPDGDAIGSAIALALLMRQLGKDAIPMVPNEYPDFLKWMPGNELMVVYSENTTKASELLQSADLIFCVDYNALHRTGNMQDTLRSAKGKKILIDHHLQPLQADFDMIFSEIETSSTSELIYKFISDCGWKDLIDKSSAISLFVGIMTDTGSFSFSCDWPETFETVAQLVRIGIQPGAIHRLVYDTYSESRLRLLGYCLSEKLTVLPEYKTAYIALTKEELNRFNHKVGDTEGVVNYALSIEGVRLAVLLTEREDKIRLSFRSTGNFSVNTLARGHFDGGGHMNAAGGDSYIPMDETIAKLRMVLAQYKDQLQRS